MKKKIVCLALVFVFVTSLLPAFAADADLSISDVTFEKCIKGDGTVDEGAVTVKVKIDTTDTTSPVQILLTTEEIASGKSIRNGNTAHIDSVDVPDNKVITFELDLLRFESLFDKDPDGETLYLKMAQAGATPATAAVAYADPYKDETVYASVYGYSLSLLGDISMNIYTELTAEAKKDKDANLTFTMPSGTKKVVPISKAIKKTISGKEYYIFSASVAAPEMIDALPFTLNACKKSYSYSGAAIKDYATRELAAIAGNASRADYDALLRSMLNYGGYSQVYFGRKTSNLANAGLYTSDNDPVLTEDIDLSGYTYEAPEMVDGINLLGTSLLLQTETILRYYFTVEGDIKDYSFSVDGNALTPAKADGKYYVEISVPAAELLDYFTLTIKKDEASTLVVYSPMNYVKNALSTSSDTKYTNLLKSLYHYGKAAKKYFGN